MTKREEAEQAMRLGPKYATEEARVALLREAINEALEEAESAIIARSLSTHNEDRRRAFEDAAETVAALKRGA